MRWPWHKKEKPLEPEKKEEPLLPSQLDRIEQKLDGHDQKTMTKFEELAKEVTLKQLIESIQNRVTRVRLSSDMERLKKLTPNQEKILSLLSQDSTRFYSYQEIADMTRLSADGVRSMVSEMAEILKGKVIFVKSKEGRKVIIKLSGLESNESPSSPSESSESDSVG